MLMARKTKNDNNKQRKIKYFTSPDTLGRLKRWKGGGGGGGGQNYIVQINDPTSTAFLSSLRPGIVKRVWIV